MMNKKLLILPQKKEMVIISVLLITVSVYFLPYISLYSRAAIINNQTLELERARVDLEKQAGELQNRIINYDRKIADLSLRLNMPGSKIDLRHNDDYFIKITNDLYLAQKQYSMLLVNPVGGYYDFIEEKNKINSIKQNVFKREKEYLEKKAIKKGISNRSIQNAIGDIAWMQAEKLCVSTQLIALDKGIYNLKSKEIKFKAQLVP